MINYFYISLASKESVRYGPLLKELYVSGRGIGIDIGKRIADTRLMV